jgi:hypothetical protein
MSQSDNHPEQGNRPVKLTPEQMEKPILVLRNFFQEAHLPEIRETLWKLVESVLSMKNAGFDDAEERSHLLWFYRELETMIEAAFLLCEKAPYNEDEKQPSSYYLEGPRPKWKYKALLEEEILNLRIKNAEQLNELLELRYFKKHGKPFQPE